MIRQVFGCTAMVFLIDAMRVGRNEDSAEVQSCRVAKLFLGVASKSIEDKLNDKLGEKDPFPIDDLGLVLPGVPGVCQSDVKVSASVDVTGFSGVSIDDVSCTDGSCKRKQFGRWGPCVDGEYILGVTVSLSSVLKAVGEVDLDWGDCAETADLPTASSFEVSLADASVQMDVVVEGQLLKGKVDIVEVKDVVINLGEGSEASCDFPAGFAKAQQFCDTIAKDLVPMITGPDSIATGYIESVVNHLISRST